MKTKITLDEVLRLTRCDDYPDERVRELFGDKTEATVQDILTDVRLPDKDRVWLICYGGFLTKTLSVEFSRFCADNARRWASEWAEWAEGAEGAEWAEWAEWASAWAEWASEWVEWADARAAERAAQVKFLSGKLK